MAATTLRNGEKSTAEPIQSAWSSQPLAGTDQETSWDILLDATSITNFTAVTRQSKYVRFAARNRLLAVLPDFLAGRLRDRHLGHDVIGKPSEMRSSTPAGRFGGTGIAPRECAHGHSGGHPADHAPTGRPCPACRAGHWSAYTGRTLPWRIPTLPSTRRSLKMMLQN